jgi:hypothetical protein
VIGLHSRAVIPRTLAVVALLLASCKKEDDTELPICLSEVAGNEAEEAQTGQLPPELWFQLLLKNYNRKTGLVAQPLRDCSGRPVEPDVSPEQASCIAGDDPPKVLPDRPLTPEDIVITPLENNQSLVWVKSRWYDNGDALGPIAITEWTKRGIAVRSIGATRAHANRARMRLEPMGESRVLVIESDVCPADKPKQCERVMRLVPMEGDRFFERPFISEDGKCLGPAAFALYREAEFPRPDGTVRRFELTRNVDFSEGQLEMSETVVIKDLDPKQPDAPPTVFRNANVRRPLVLAKTGIVTKAGLWEAMVSEHGSVALPPAKKDD